MRYGVHIFEPYINPGGYYDIFYVDADNEEEACRAAGRLASNRWPDHNGLEVWLVDEIKEEE